MVPHAIPTSRAARVVQTTPDCNEGVRWHVFNEQPPLAPSLVQALERLISATTADAPGAPQQNYRHNNRPVQPLNGRTVYFHDTGAARNPGSSPASGCYGDAEPETPAPSRRAGHLIKRRHHARG